MTKRILVTGAGGFVGSHFLEHVLVNTDWDIVITDSFRHKGTNDRIAEVVRGENAPVPLIPGSYTSWQKRIDVITHDLLAPFTKREILRIGEIDYIAAIASESHVDRSISDPSGFIRNNIEVALNTLDLAREIKPKAVIWVSTDEVYGPVAKEDLKGHPEWDTILPSNPYCLHPGTDIVTRRGLVTLSDLDPVRDRVLSRDGSGSGSPDAMVRRTWKYVTDKTLLRIKTLEGAEEILSTPEHRFFRRSHDPARGGGTEEVQARELRTGDRVCVIRKIPFPPDAAKEQDAYARFLGYWLADGSFGGKNNYVRLADQKREYIDFYRDQAHAAFGTSAKSRTGVFGTVYKHGTKDCWYLQFGSEAQRSRIDLSDRLNVIEQAMNFAPEALGQFLAGWLDGDGSISRKDGKVVRAEITCYDDRLRRTLKYLFRRFGVVAVNDESGKRVTVTDAASLKLLRDSVPSLKWHGDDEFRTPQKKRGRAANWMWARVSSVEEEAYDGKVMDLEVPEYSNYVAAYFLTHNSGSKAAQEDIAISYWRTYGVPVIILNIMNMIGERQDLEKFIPRVISKVSRDEEVVIHGSPGNIGTRHYLHARNVADASLFLLNYDKPSVFPAHASLAFEKVSDRPDRYNIASPDRIDNLTLAKLIAEYAGKELRYRLEDFHTTRPGHDPHYGLDPSKIMALGWEMPVPFHESLKKTVEWTLANPAWLLPD